LLEKISTSQTAFTKKEFKITDWLCFQQFLTTMRLFTEEATGGTKDYTTPGMGVTLSRSATTFLPAQLSDLC
jgi:hypothetical protein